MLSWVGKSSRVERSSIPMINWLSQRLVISISCLRSSSWALAWSRLSGSSQGPTSRVLSSGSKNTDSVAESFVLPSYGVRLMS